jgi:hypothetical protein
MNNQRLKECERQFLIKYPGGFMHPEMQTIGKKHRMDRMVENTQSALSKKSFNDPQAIVESIIKLVNQSSMISIFEKPKFRDFVKSLRGIERQFFVDSYKALLHGNQAKGFEALRDQLATAKLAKWSLITIIPAYYKPETEVFVKPTTTKGVIAYFELDDVVYSPKPTYAFYEKYREHIMAMKSKIGPELSPSNAAFCGFLMMSLNK